VTQAILELSEVLGQENVSTDEEVLKYHGFSEWSPANIERLPIAVVFPHSTEQVSRIARICHRYRVPMTAFSGGSSLEGNYAAPHGGISIDFAYMNQILAFHEEDMDIVVQPAVNWVSLNQSIFSSNLFFPVDPSPSAQIGGMVGTNCSGTNAVRYGTMKDWVVNLTVVLADGTVVKTRGRPRKSAAGYNLNGLFVGSEGTLGLVTEITLRLAGIPKEVGVASSIMRAGIQVAALEYLDATQMKVLNEGAYTAPKFWKEAPTIFFKFSGSKGSIAEDIKSVKAIVKRNGGTEFEFARSGREGEVIWSGRKQALWSLLAARPEGTELWTTDVAVPVSRLADMIGMFILFSSW
jgi:D-lactate dehydrogenase (cytochrome)